MEVVFDPRVVTFAELVEVFWKAHDPTRRSSSRRYRDILFVLDEEQAHIARQSKRRLEETTDAEIRTEIRELHRFWVGERKHQKYNLRRVARVRREYEEMFDDANALRDSTAVAHANGYAAGFGTLADFERTAHQLGLSDEALDRLRRRVEAGEARCKDP